MTNDGDRSVGARGLLFSQTLGKKNEAALAARFPSVEEATMHAWSLLLNEMRPHTAASRFS